ncbi:DUF724 domain-containing protein 6-like isoform X2 [Cornus florida]|uniref:DUF724 domain-containing protein 6-like isoform X2 n=1 Tax=Cornus florida TaxID=4283 RepID=UPI00289C48B0|nr:DUF724 domain-containing protein 6-like isoform X2 [Cornus florida]
MGGGGGGEQKVSLFAKGSLVEVGSDEEGFKGAWYVATVLEPPQRSASKKKNQNRNNRVVHVEYQTLLAEEDGSEHLREQVNVEFVRPLPPPPEDDVVHSFELNDIVDAFYRDGWWTGVITRLLHNSRFVVTFQNPPDEIEFGLSELRYHRDWVDGKWVRPQKLKTEGSIFGIGKKVEVSFDKEEHRDVWFPAIVLEDFGNNSFLVEYQSLGVDVEAGPLKVTVDFLHIRPSPPYFKDKIFVLLEKVDAFYDFGWWGGVITKELADSKYIVFFKHTNKERELKHSELRPHMDWIDGKWVSASQDVLIPSDYQEHVQYACNDANNTEMAVQLLNSCAAKDNYEERTPRSFDLRENKAKQSTPCNEKTSSYGIATQRRKSKHTTPDSVASHSRPLKKLKEDAAKAPSPTACPLNMMTIQTPSKETLCGFANPSPAGTGINISKEPVVGDQPSAKSDSLCQGKKQNKQLKVGELDNHTPTPVKRKRSVKSQVKSSQSSAGGNKGNTGSVMSEEFVEKECITKETDLPVIIGLECNGLRGLQGRKSHHFPSEESLKLLRDQKEQLNDSTRHKIKEINRLEEGGESNLKKRRGRPPKLRAKSPEASVAGKEQSGDMVATDEIVVKDCITSEVELAAITGVRSARIKGSLLGNEYLKLVGDDKKLPDGLMKQKNNKMKTPPARKDKLSSEKVVQESSRQREKYSSMRSRRRRAGVNIESPFQDSQDDSRGEKTTEDFGTDFITEGVEMAIDKLPSSMSDDQPLSMWFEGMHSPAVDGSRVSTARTVQHTEAIKRDREIAIQSPAVDANGDNVPDESRSLPFVKTFPLWETIETMEVFRAMPQKPHFRPLDSCKESSREGLAIGSMVTFSSVVKKTFDLHFDDPRSVIEDSLDTLLDLESHGFDVKMVRDRLTGLLLLKDKQEQLQEQTTELKTRIMEHSHQKSKIDEEIDEIDKQIRELQEKRALVVPLKDFKDSEIASLQSRVEDITEDIKSVKLDFEGLAAAPW